MSSLPAQQRVFSGIQPTGRLHLGNYLGALHQFKKLQSQYACLYCVVDLHALTIPHDPVQLREDIYESVATFLACGLDPIRHILFNQSQVSGHAELTWIFNCLVPMGWLNRMTQFKEKAGKDRENASAGLYSYPVLMAADILLYRANRVPVGEDQKQHIELARDIAQKFNKDYGEFFPLPEPWITGPAPRVMSLRDGRKKMSKSDSSDYSRINLSDESDIIALKIRKAKTDALPLPSDIKDLHERAEAANLVNIYAALKECELKEVLQEFGGGQFSAFKQALIDLTVSTLSPIHGEIKRLRQDQNYLSHILKEGAMRAESIARPNLARIKDLVGLVATPC